ncbi:CRISPR-associated protein [Halomonas sp. THAF5a]|uniref:type III-B CRISPR module-associated protein Cmr5 n=1 Tax=Halomonas sp. THAF5a TaxID=2587844 RepID=UPI0012A8C660|nr:type III-B CRISPR module-associated protein Cmr5 [Halomonas sp. THAF5a]QFU02559.1 CRISPR-associated protein [Halomonas sp. THAF5a]
MSSSSGRSLRLVEQRRAEFALQRLQEALAESENSQYQHTQLKSYLRRLPAMIQMNGFGQAMAFYFAKRTNYAAYGVIYKLLEDWLCGDGAVYAGQAVTPGLHPAEPVLLQALMSQDQHHYRRATAETQAMLAWAKKFAEALIVKDDVEEAR